MSPIVIDLGNNCPKIDVQEHDSGMASVTLSGEHQSVRLVGTRKTLRNLALDLLRNLQDPSSSSPPPERGGRPGTGEP